MNQIVQKITPEWMKNQIDDSNKGAADNRNYYPIQEQATQQEIWEYIPCSCDSNCTCKKLGCTHHWKLKRGIGFEQFRDGFLRTFVSNNHHRAVISALEGRGTDQLTSRSIWAYHILRNLQADWGRISEKAAGHSKTLFCDDWLPGSLRERMSFPVEGTSVYKAKQFSILYPDTGVPYDTASRVKMLSHFGLFGVNYAEFLTVVRREFLDCMSRHGLTIPELRRFDSPGTRLLFDATEVSLPHKGRDYGNTYSPAERTIGFVLDKCFYNPKNPTPGTNHAKRSNVVRDIRIAENQVPGVIYTTYPLSGRGEEISVSREATGWKITWGKTEFRLTNEMVRIILNGFFLEPDRWYQLGASMTEPDPVGLGAFLKKSFSSFTSRHASAVAAVMVDEGFVVSRGSRPIELKKVIGERE